VEGNRTWIVDGALVNPETGPGRRMDLGSRGLVRWSSCVRNNISSPILTKPPPPQTHILRVFFEPPCPLRFRRPPPTAPALLHFNGWKYFMGYYYPGRCSNQISAALYFQSYVWISVSAVCIIFFLHFHLGDIAHNIPLFQDFCLRRTKIILRGINYASPTNSPNHSPKSLSLGNCFAVIFLLVPPTI